jgi:hypothetical protein
MTLVKLTKQKEWVWKALELNPLRAEAFYHYLKHMREEGKYSQELYAMAVYASKIPLPSFTNLFVERDVYDWRIKDELSLIASHTNHKDVAIKTSEEIVKENKYPADQKQRLLANLAWFSK